MPASTPQDLVATIDALCPIHLSIAPHMEDLRYRHMAVEGEHLYILYNEGIARVSMDGHVAEQCAASWIAPWRGEEQRINGTPLVTLAPP